MSDDIGQLEADLRARIDRARQRGVAADEIGTMLLYLSDEYRTPPSTPRGGYEP